MEQQAYNKKLSQFRQIKVPLPKDQVLGTSLRRLAKGSERGEGVRRTERGDLIVACEPVQMLHARWSLIVYL